jgi:hypothetical protein
VPAAGAGMVLSPAPAQDTTPARAGPHAGATVAGNSPAQQHITAHISSLVLRPIALVPMVPSATVRMGGHEFPAGHQGVSRQAAALRSPGRVPRASVSWCRPATAAQLPERDGMELLLPAAAAAGGVHGRSPARAAPRPRGTVSWCQPAEELQPLRR